MYCNEKIYIIVFLLSIFSCNKEELEIKNIDFSIEKLQKSTISELISNYSIVKLESNGDSKINIAKKVIIQDDKIFVLNHQENMQEFLIFKMDGTFINKISEEGGRGYEFINIVDFDIHPLNGDVYILDQNQRRIRDFLKNIKSNVMLMRLF